MLAGRRPQMWPHRQLMQRCWPEAHTYPVQCLREQMALPFSLPQEQRYLVDHFICWPYKKFDLVFFNCFFQESPRQLIVRSIRNPEDRDDTGIRVGTTILRQRNQIGTKGIQRNRCRRQVILGFDGNFSSAVLKQYINIGWCVLHTIVKTFSDFFYLYVQVCGAIGQTHFIQMSRCLRWASPHAFAQGGSESRYPTKPLHPALCFAPANPTLGNQYSRKCVLQCFVGQIQFSNDCAYFLRPAGLFGKFCQIKDLLIRQRTLQKLGITQKRGYVLHFDCIESVTWGRRKTETSCYCNQQCKADTST